MSDSGTMALPTRLRRAAEAARAALRTVLDLALPPLCAACREPVDGKGLCPACWSKLSFIARPYCERLGVPFVYDPGPGILSMEAIASPPAYHRARAAVRFDDISRALVHALKYGDRLDLAPMMGRWLSQARCTGAGTPARAAPLGGALQPVGHSPRRRFQGERRADRRPRAQAREIHRPAGRAVAHP